VCGNGGTADFGDPCSAQSDCLAGLFCAAADDAGTRTCASFPVAFPPFQGVSCNDDPDGGLKVYFEVPRPGAPPADFFRLPYPNDIRVDSNRSPVLDISDFPTPGLSPLDVDIVALYRDALAQDFDGFSPIAPVTFRFSSAIDYTTLNIQIVDLTPPSPGAFVWAFAYVLNGNKYNCPNRLTISPGESTPYHPGHTYAVLLKTGVKDSNNNLVVPDADFQAMLTPTAPTDGNLSHAWSTYAVLRTWLADPTNGVLPSQLVSAAVFTVADPLKTMTKLKTVMSQLPAPAVSDLSVCGTSGTASTCDALGTDHACAAQSNDFYEIHGRMALPIFQSGTEPYLTPAEGGGIAVDASGNPVKQRDEAVCFALTVPKSGAPDGGWPLLITHHGTGGSSTDFISSGVADALAKGGTPMAVLGFDAVEHADRRGGSTENPENLVFNLTNPRAARDNWLQGAADILSEVKMATVAINVTGGPASPIGFDPSQVEFFGHSQGATSGELALPFMDTVPNAVVSGAGAHLTQSLLHKTNPVSSKAGLAALIQEDIAQLDTEHPVLGILQNYFDRSDPLSYNDTIVNDPLDNEEPHSILMTWGTGDTYTPKETLQANALSLGLPTLGTPLEWNGGAPPSVSRPVSGNDSNSGAAETAVVIQYQTASGSDGHFVAFDVAQAETDWTHFLQSGLNGNTPNIP
jgi:predicted esterase